MTITLDLVKVFVWLYVVCAVPAGIGYTIKILKAETKGEAIGNAIGVCILATATYLLAKAYL